MKIRKAAVAGKFYPDNEQDIIKLIEQFRAKERDKLRLELADKNIIGAVLPHAGYIYSAYEAIHYFEILAKSHQQVDTFVIINPNHTGYGTAISLDSNDAWQTPMGEILLDTEMMNLLSFPKVPEAHRYEHSAEVMLPFLQYFNTDRFKILPISFFEQNPGNARKIATEIFAAAKITNQKVHFLASSDFSHYIDPEFGRLQDNKIISRILNFDLEGVYQTVRKNNISACGYGPIMSLMHFAKLFGEEYKIEILRSGNSGEVFPSDEVVDYISILFYQ